ncbi:hypothetical protein Tco_0718573 [Tanacetum coccineum]
MIGQIRQIPPLGNPHWGKKRRQIYALYATSRKSDSNRLTQKGRIIASTKVEIVVELCKTINHLDWMYCYEGKVTNLNVEERIAFNVSLRMFTRSVVIQRRVEDLQLFMDPLTLCTNPSQPLKVRNTLFQNSHGDTLIDYWTPRHARGRSDNEEQVDYDESNTYVLKDSNNYKLEILSRRFFLN